jgi:predicted ArsR family transcriptional regulator
MTAPRFDDLVRTVQDRSHGRLEEVGAAVAVAEELGALGDRLVTHFVAAAREAGCSWSQIGAQLGVSKQAAQQGFVAGPGKRRFARRRPTPGPGGPFTAFTPPARRVVVLAQDEARALWHNYVGTEHLLLGLLRHGEGVGARALSTLGISAEGVRAHVETIIGRGQAPVGDEIPFTPRTKKVLELSVREARRLGRFDVDTEHLLLGLLREGEGVAVQILVKLGVDLPRLPQAVLDA